MGRQWSTGTADGRRQTATDNRDTISTPSMALAQGGTGCDSRGMERGVGLSSVVLSQPHQKRVSDFPDSARPLEFLRARFHWFSAGQCHTFRFLRHRSLLRSHVFHSTLRDRHQSPIQPGGNEIAMQVRPGSPHSTTACIPMSRLHVH